MSQSLTRKKHKCRTCDDIVNVEYEMYTFLTNRHRLIANVYMRCVNCGEEFVPPFLYALNQSNTFFNTPYNQQVQLLLEEIGKHDDNNETC